tara:strand:+ start:154435 stop:154935 length:501 start_codon:yes stop_codon:yes gene_type:complete
MKDQKHTHGFTTPKDYFESFDARLLQRLSEENMPKESGFKVPPKYFESFEGRLLKRIDNLEETAKVRPLFGKRTMIYAAAIAACAVMIFSVFNFQKNSNTDINELQLSNIESYIEDGNLDFSALDIVAFIDDDQLSSFSFDDAFLSEENIEEYLLENLDSTSLLTE